MRVHSMFQTDLGTKARVWGHDVRGDNVLFVDTYFIDELKPSEKDTAEVDSMIDRWVETMGGDSA